MLLVAVPAVLVVCMFYSFNFNAIYIYIYIYIFFFFHEKILHIPYFPFYSLIYWELLLFLGEEGIKNQDPNVVGNKTMCMMMGLAFMAISLWNLYYQLGHTYLIFFNVDCWLKCRWSSLSSDGKNYGSCHRWMMYYFNFRIIIEEYGITNNI